MESNCCGAEIYENTDICSDCKEHCTAVEFCDWCGETVDTACYTAAEAEPCMERQVRWKSGGLWESLDKAYSDLINLEVPKVGRSDD